MDKNTCSRLVLKYSRNKHKYPEFKCKYLGCKYKSNVLSGMLNPTILYYTRCIYTRYKYLNTEVQQYKYQVQQVCGLR